MSEPEKPADAPVSPPAPPPEPPAAEPKPDRVQLQREKAAQRQAKPHKPVPSLEHEQSYGFGQKIEAFDADMERELEEAMAGFSDKEMSALAEPERAKRAEPEKGPKKGRVFRIHGQDVFIDLPGGRSQGVMPLEMFPEGRPTIGDEVDVHIEGFDNANGLLLLSRQGAAITADWDSVAVGQVVEARVLSTNKG